MGINKHNTQTILKTVALAFFMLYFYTFLHEIGHGIIGLMAGGSITKIKLGFGAYIRIVDANYTAFTLPLMNVFGVLLPVLVCTIMLLFYSKKVQNFMYQLFHFLFSINVIASILPWIFLPITYNTSSAPLNDDVIKFIKHSGLPPWQVSVYAFIVLIALVALAFIVKKVHKHYFKVAQSYQK